MQKVMIIAPQPPYLAEILQSWLAMQLAELAKERSSTLLATKAKSRKVSREEGSYGTDIDESDDGDPNVDLGSLQSLLDICMGIAKESRAVISSDGSLRHKPCRDCPYAAQ